MEYEAIPQENNTTQFRKAQNYVTLKKWFLFYENFPLHITGARFEYNWLKVHMAGKERSVIERGREGG